MALGPFRALYCCSVGAALELVHGNTLSAKLISFAQEAFAREALNLQGVPFVSKLIPEFMELSIVWANPVMTELVQQRIEDLLKAEELSWVSCVAETEVDGLAVVDIEAPKICLLREEFAQLSYPPPSLSHYWLHA